MFKDAGGVGNIIVLINETKPRKGSFVISVRGSGGKGGGGALPVSVLSLLDLPRPFARLKALDMEEVAANVVDALLVLETSAVRDL